MANVKKSRESLLEKRATVEAAFRKKKESERRALDVVEHIVENSAVEIQWLADNAKFLNPQYYQDAIEERAIIKQCGFPICNNHIEKVLKQQYHIDLRSKKVYDVTQRKNFCSDVCYSASNHFKNQLLTSPLWMRTKEKIPKFEVNPAPKKSLCGDEVALAAVAVPENEDSNTDAEFAKEKTTVEPKIRQKIVPKLVVNPCELIFKIMQQWFTARSFKWLHNIADETFLGDGVNSVQEKLIQMNINKPNAKENEINQPPRTPFKSDTKSEDSLSLLQVRAFFAGQLEYAVEKDDGAIIKDNTGDVIENADEAVSIIIPLANVSAQKNLRKNIVMDYVEKGFLRLTTVTGLEFRRYQRDLIQLVSTFNLTADTITFRSHEIPFLCFILIIFLAKRDLTVKERITCEPVKTEVSKFLAVFEQTVEQLEVYVIDLCKPFENLLNKPINL